MFVGSVLENDAAGNFFHEAELPAQLPVIGDGGLHMHKLFVGQSHGHGLLRHFAGPLVTRATPGAGGSVLDGALGDVTDLSHPPAQLLKLPAAPLRGWKVWPHARYFSGFNLPVNLIQ